MKRLDLEISLTPRQKKFYVVLGTIISCITLGVGFIIFYDIFFEREQYLTRKRLLAYLKKIV